jgi:UDP-glucose 6-dehydrogenase
MITSISVVGLGKLGSPLAACFAAARFRVHAVDADEKKVDAFNRGVPPVHEPGLSELMQESGGRLRASQDAEQAVRDSDATFIVVGTPRANQAEGSLFDMSCPFASQSVGSFAQSRDFISWS